MYLPVAGCNLKMDCSHIVTYQIWVLAHFIRDRAQERDSARVVFQKDSFSLKRDRQLNIRTIWSL